MILTTFKVAMNEIVGFELQISSQQNFVIIFV